MENKENQKADAATQAAAVPENNKKRRPWFTWLVVLLLPVAFLLPIWAERIQVKLIGYEGICCMPDNMRELEQAAARARSMRSESNEIIGTGIGLAFLVTAIVIFVLYVFAIPCIRTKWRRRVAQVVMGVIIAPFVFLVFLTLEFFASYNNAYHRMRYQPPQDTIYAYALDLVTPHPDWWYQWFEKENR